MDICVKFTKIWISYMVIANTNITAILQLIPIWIAHWRFVTLTDYIIKLKSGMEWICEDSTFYTSYLTDIQTGLWWHFSYNLDDLNVVVGPVSKRSYNIDCNFNSYFLTLSFIRNFSKNWTLISRWSGQASCLLKGSLYVRAVHLKK